MRNARWFAVALMLATPMAGPAWAADEAPPAEEAPAAAQLPQACVDAGIADETECAGLMAEQKAAKKAAAAKAAADKAAADQAAADEAAAQQAVAEKAAADKAAADKAMADQAAADKAAADQAAADAAAAKKSAADQAAAEKAASDAAAAQQAEGAAAKAAADQALAEEAAAQKAAATKAAAAKAAADQAAAEQAANAADAEAAQQAAAAKAAADQANADKAAAEAALAKLAADKAAAEQAAADKAAGTAAQAPADTPLAKPAKKGPRVKLAQDCLEAGATTPEECDAFHAIAAQTPTPKAPAAAAVDPAPALAPIEPASATPVPVAPAGALPPEVTATKSVPEAPAEPVATAAPALPDIAKGLAAAAKSHNRAVAALAKADGDPAAAEKARARIDAASAEIDALCKSNKFDSTAQCLAQFAVELTPMPVAGGSKQAALAPAPIVQPVETIDRLPKGLKKEDIAPLLDSAKDQAQGKGPDAPPPGAAKALDAVQTAALAAPPPKSDKAAQAGLASPTKVVSIDQQKGQAMDATAVAQIQVPQNVTIVTQNVVNNTTNITTNNTTNNTQILNAPAAPSKPGQAAQLLPGKRDKFQRGGPPDNPIGLGIGIVLQFGNQTIVSSPAEDHRRIAYNSQDRTDYERLPEGRFRETVRRADGVRIVTVYNRNGDILRRSRFGRDGREIVLAYFDDRHDRELLDWHDPAEDLPPLRLRIPAREYVMDAGRADQRRVQQFFAQPPVERVRRIYSIAEVKRSSRVRDMVRRLEIGNLTFNSGAATVSQDQVGNLAKVAGAMLNLLDRSPGETFLIEGHTDAVGGEIANLQLSDARAATIARILTDFYGVPPENLATQGYGERYLKVETELAERLNRRVTVRRITSLVTLSRN
jgi:outer membrane protein OmpA-like peptidoglycan-associated protein